MAEANTAVHGENQVERRLIRPREIAAYALTSYGLNNLTTYVGSTKQYFMMSFLGLSGTAYGTLSTIATVWDALDDPISGIIIDRCRTRWGRLRPFLIFPMPFWAISSIRTRLTWQRNWPRWELACIASRSWEIMENGCAQSLRTRFLGWSLSS